MLEGTTYPQLGTLAELMVGAFQTRGGLVLLVMDFLHDDILTIDVQDSDGNTISPPPSFQHCRVSTMA